MSEARNKFFEALRKIIEPTGYVFQKTKKKFTLSEEPINFSIMFNWDGRGGLTYLNNVSGLIEINYVNKALKTVLNYKFPYPVSGQMMGGGFFDETIPQMYSRNLLELANNMAFKKMAAMPFDEKYPPEKITKMVDRVAEIITAEVIPNNQKFNSEQKLLDNLIESVLTKLNAVDTHNTLTTIFVIKVMCKKMKISEPTFVSGIRIFTNQSIDDLWNMQNFDLDKMEEKFNNLKF